ncbi:unnamed protein product [Symbiodinium sp. CCMP2456]|nr:unnamed protein product [Symbiodinium sp. CCMP2456]
MAGVQQDSAIEYLLALQATPRSTPRRAPICCAPGAFAVCSVEKCGCVEDVACAEIDESFSTQASDISEEASASGTVASAVRVKPWQYVEACFIFLSVDPLSTSMARPIELHFYLACRFSALSGNSREVKPWHSGLTVALGWIARARESEAHLATGFAGPVVQFRRSDGQTALSGDRV